MGAIGRPVLITGGCGFIGSYIARILLSQGREAVAYDPHPLTGQTRYVLGSEADRYTYYEGGVEDWGRLMEVVDRVRPEAIVHAAAIVNTTWLFKHPIPAFQINAGGTVNVLEVARLMDVARVLFVSSIGVLPSVQYQPIDANHPLILANEGPGSGFYGAAKVAGEAFGFCYKDAFGVDFRVIRPSAPYGFAMGWPMFVKPMVEGAVRGEPVRFASGGPFPRSYTHIEDVASLAVAILDGPDDADRVFYGAHGGALTTAAEVAALVRDLIPGADIAIGDELDESDRYELNFRAPLSVANAERQLGWRPRYPIMRDGISEYVDQYRGYIGARSGKPAR